MTSPSHLRSVIKPTVASSVHNDLIVHNFVMQNCQLGQHVPLEKDIGVDGIVLASGDPSATTNDTDDANTSTRHGELVMMVLTRYL